MVDAIPTDNVINKGYPKAVAEKLKHGISGLAAESECPVWVETGLTANS